MSNWKETPGQTQDMLERFSLLAGLGVPEYTPRALGAPVQTAVPITRTSGGKLKDGNQNTIVVVSSNTRRHRQCRFVECSPRSREWV